MKTSQLRASDLLAYDDHPSLSFTPSILQCQTNAASENRARSFSQVERGAAASPDPFTFYKTYLNTNEPLLGDQENLKSDGNGYPCHSGAAAYNASADDAQRQARGHTTAYKLAVRLANRSNGAPLATIIEQGSYSTLNSHGSLLSVGRFPSLKAAEDTSPSRGSRRRSRSLDEKALHDIQEDLTREYDTCTVAVPHARLDGEHGAADETSRTATPSTSHRFELQQSPSPSEAEPSDHDIRGVKGLVRGVLQTVRGVSRTRSRSSSMTHLPIVEHRESSPSTGGSSLQLDQEGQGSESYHQQNENRSISTRVSQTTAVVSVSRDQNRNRGEHSACTYSSLPHPRSALTDATTVFGSMPLALPWRATRSSHEQPFSTFAARTGTRDVAREDDTNQAAISHHDMLDTSARHAVNGVPVYDKNPSSLKEVSSAREVFANQNASFCSTMSTSYSGTVLGVDLDLQHDFNNLARRSQSPPTPVWFTPQMAELERQASFSESPESIKAYIQAHTPYRSITSSALTSLLPIAAASGIVQPVYNTPGISFYSPSGNLIYPESGSPRSTSLSEHGSSPNITTPYYNEQCTSAGSLPIRPILVPMTTSPIHRTPLPPHLQHHHGHHRPEKSQITSCKSTITPKGPVKGCDGVVRENSLTPRSGIFYPHGKDKIHRSIKMTLHDLKAEINFYKARFVALAATHSFAPSLPKNKNLQRRHVCNYNTYARNSHVNPTSKTGPRKGRSREDVLGPVAAHALRVCFCQPYDGAGKPTHATATGACFARELVSKSSKLNAGQHAKDAEQILPNARIVGSGGRSQGGDAKRATRRDSAIGSTARGASKTGMARKKMD
ncbi:uncharacterized protein EKO05_0005966 [Ascochyta rabiei]|uniref:uncharacterized protein n=1 Tax=Didymella rabiei TaxID=5454 RepID=UPI002203C8A1|nr:uncharacterized protein EKO05_0005966 [Ascochyta rabiei]UPX15521.1 hypothetical protein EKO05_0005966 [Ascochyta rabiei]